MARVVLLAGTSLMTCCFDSYGLTRTSIVTVDFFVMSKCPDAKLCEAELNWALWSWGTRVDSLKNRIIHQEGQPSGIARY